MCAEYSPSANLIVQVHRISRQALPVNTRNACAYIVGRATRDGHMLDIGCGPRFSRAIVGEERRKHQGLHCLQLP